MKLTQLETSGLRGLDGAFAIEPDRNRPGFATVVTGPARCGLSTFLDAIALSAARLSTGGRAPGAAEVVRAGGRSATIKSRWWLAEDERKLGGIAEETTAAEVVFELGGLGRVSADPALLALMSRYDHSPETAKVVAIPAQRVSDAAPVMIGDFETDQRMRRFQSDASRFASLGPALVRIAAGFGEGARLAAAARLLGELCPVKLGATAAGQLEFALGSGARVPLRQLSFSERNAFVLAAAPALLGLQRSVILLDTPELGLPPGVAARWLEALRAAYPQAQWIVASRDPEVVQSVEPAARIDLGKQGAKP